MPSLYSMNRLLALKPTAKPEAAALSTASFKTEASIVYLKELTPYTVQVLPSIAPGKVNSLSLSVIAKQVASTIQPATVSANTLTLFRHPKIDSEKLDVVVDNKRRKFLTDYELPVYENNPGVPPSAGLILYPEGKELLGSGIKLRWSGSVPAPDSWVISIGTAPTLRDISQVTVPVTLENGEYVAVLTGYPTDGSSFFVSLSTKIGGAVSYLDYKEYSAIVGAFPQIVDPVGVILDDDQKIKFTLNPLVTTEVKVGTVTQNITATKLYQLLNVPASNTTVVFQVTQKLVTATKNEFYHTLIKPFTAFAPATITALPNPLTSDKQTLQWATPGWTDVDWWQVQYKDLTNNVAVFSSPVLPATTRELPNTFIPPNNTELEAVLTWSREGHEQTATVTTYAALLKLTKLSGGSSLAGVSDTFSWESMPYTDSYQLSVTHQGVELFNSGVLAPTVTNVTVPLLPLGSAVPVEFKLTHKYQGTVSVQTRAYTSATSLILDPPTNLLGDALELRWQGITAGQDSIIVRVNGLDRVLPPESTSVWLYNLPPTGTVIQLLTLKAGATTLLQEVTPARLGNPTTLVQPSAVTHDSEQFIWNPSLLSSDQVVQLIDNLGTVIVQSSLLSSLDTTATLSGIPEQPNPVRARIVTTYQGNKHAVVVPLENNRVFIEVTIPETRFTYTSQRIAWAMQTSEPILAFRIKVVARGTNATYYDSQELPPEARDVIAGGLPNLGEDVTIVLQAKKQSGVWFEKKYDRKAWDVNAPVPTVTYPQPFQKLKAEPFTLKTTASGATLVSWRVVLGDSPRAGNVYDSGVVTPSTTSFQIPKIETGKDIFYTLYYTDTNGVDNYSEGEFKTTFVPPDLYEPECHGALSSAYTGSTAIYQWRPHGVLVVKWQLRIVIEATNVLVYDSGELLGASVSAVVHGHPIQGELLKVSLKYQDSAGVWSELLRSCKAHKAEPYIVSPAEGTTLLNDFETFTWTADGVSANSWAIRLVDTEGVVVSETTNLPANTLTGSLQGINPNGNTKNVQIGYNLVTGAPYTYKDTLYKSKAAPAIVSPKTIVPPTVRVRWTNNGTLVGAYQVRVGSSLGASDLGESPVLPPSTTAFSFLNIPVDGRPVFIELRYEEGGVSKFHKVERVATLVAPEISTISRPFSGAKTIRWVDNSVPIQGWELLVGTSQGGTDIANITSTVVTDREAEVTLPPTVGTAYYTLRFQRVGSNTLETVEATSPLLQTPFIVSPAEGSLLHSTDLQIVWDSGTDPDVEKWQVTLGSQPSTANIYDSGVMSTPRTVETITGVPLSQSSVTATLRYFVTSTGKWEKVYATYPTQVPEPIITTDIVGKDGKITQVIDSFEYLFSWESRGLVTTDYKIVMGSTKGGKDIYESSPLSGNARTHTITGIPDDGRTLYVTLSWNV